MIKKLVSKALLSVVMDKDARERLETRKRLKKAVNALPADAADGDAPPTVEDPRQQALESLALAERVLGTKRKMTPEREALIQQALATQKAKEHLLDALSPEQREKLYVMAMKQFDLDPAAEARLKAGKPARKRRK